MKILLASRLICSCYMPLTNNLKISSKLSSPAYTAKYRSPCYRYPRKGSDKMNENGREACLSTHAAT